MTKMCLNTCNRKSLNMGWMNYFAKPCDSAFPWQFVFSITCYITKTGKLGSADFSPFDLLLRFSHLGNLSFSPPSCWSPFFENLPVQLPWVHACFQFGSYQRNSSRASPQHRTAHPLRRCVLPMDRINHLFHRVALGLTWLVLNGQFPGDFSKLGQQKMGLSII